MGWFIALSPLRTTLNTNFVQMRLLIVALVIMSIAISCSGRGQYEVQGISFEAPSSLDIREFTLDLNRGIFREGPTSFEQGVMTSRDRNFLLEWVYTPDYSLETAREQALNAPAFFSGTGVSVRTVGTPDVELINGYTVTSVELDFRWSGGGAPGITGVWQCLPSQRAIIFIAIHKNPQAELKKLMSSFSCT